MSDKNLHNVTLGELAQAAGVDVENVAELSNVLKQAAQQKKSVETLENMQNAFLEKAAVLESRVAELEVEKAKRAEAEAIAAAEDAKLKEAFQNAKGSAKAGIFGELSDKMGRHNAEVFLTGNEFVKALTYPLIKSDPMHDVKKELRTLHNDVLCGVAVSGGLTAQGISKPGEDRALHVDKAVREQIINAFEKSGLYSAEAIDLYKKGINDAFDTTEQSAWIPSVLSPDVIDNVWLDLRVASLFERVYMPTPVYRYPTRTGRGRAYRVSESTLNTQFYTNQFISNSFDVGSVQLSAKKLGAHILYSDEITEDSIVAIAQAVRDDAIISLASTIEDAVLNGSSLLTDLDNASTDTNRLWANTANAGDGIRLNTGAQDGRNMWDGIRKSTPAGAQMDLATLSSANLLALRGRLGKYGLSAEELRLIVSPRVIFRLLPLPEVITVDKMGPQATVLRGQLASLFATPIVASEFVYENLNATGVFNQAVNNRAVVLYVRPDGWMFGDRRRVTVEQQRMVLSGQTGLVAHWRGDFVKKRAATEIESAVGFNVTP